MALTVSDQTWSDLSSEPLFPFVREFEAICQGRRADQILRYWHDVEPALRQVPRLDLMVPRIRAVAGQAQDALLLALIRLAQGHDQVAAIALLAAMSPKCWSIARRVNHQLPYTVAVESTDELRRIAEDTMFEQIMRFPVDRIQRGIAGALGLNTLRSIVPSRHGRDRDPQPISFEDLKDVLARAGSLEGRPEPIEQLLEPGGMLRGLAAGASEDVEERLECGDVPTRQTEVVAVLYWGVFEAGAIKVEDGRLLAEVYLVPGDTTGLKEAARRRGISVGAAKQRCSRAARQLAAAVSAANGTRAASAA